LFDPCHVSEQLPNYAIGERDHVTTRTILAELCNIEEAPWADMRGKPLDSRGLANLLKEYGVRSVTVRIGNITVKGYRRADLVDVWRRYLPAQTDNSDTNVTNGTAGDESDPHVADVTDVSELDWDKDDLDNDPLVHGT
jgi:Protein of unknown function (DUF3631)